MRAALGVRYSAAVVRVEARGRLRFERAYGRTRDDGAALPCWVDTAFDIASITKVYVATVALALVAAGRLDLDAALTDVVPEWRGTPHEPIVLRRILAHDAGFKSGADYRTLLDTDVERFALTEPLADAPGARVIYSDLGFIALGTVVARAARAPLARVVEQTLRAFGARATRYRPPGPARRTIPATETDAWRGSVQGRVHDEKAFLMNGVAGHAGLFGDARDCALLAEWYLGALNGRATPLPRELARAAVEEAAYDPVLRRGLGWALKTRDDNSCGALASPATFGHTGFTGTCLWADPQRDASVVFLTNNVHHGRTDLREVRAAVCDAAFRALDAAS